MEGLDHISIETALWFLGGTGTIIGGLLVYIFAKLDSKVSRIETKIDLYEAKNADDHARVNARLAALEERTQILLDRE